MALTRRSRATLDPAPSTTATVDTTKDTAGTADFDFDKAIVSAVDKELWAAIFDGDFRLAVPCDICGRWLTAGKSKRAHRGPRCAARIAEAVTDV